MDVTSSSGEVFGAYLATPPGAAGPGVVLLHEIFGITTFMRNEADRLAGKGFVAIVPDLFWRTEPGIELTDEGSDLERALDLGRRYDLDRGAHDVQQAVGALVDLPAHSGGVALVGYCLGGSLALQSATVPGVVAVAAYYPVRLGDHLDTLAAVSVPAVVHLGGQDELCPPATQQQIRQVAPPQVDVHVYPDAGHAFANSTRAGYHRFAADAAYSRTSALLRRTLGPSC